MHNRIVFKITHKTVVDTHLRFERMHLPVDLSDSPKHVKYLDKSMTQVFRRLTRDRPARDNYCSSVVTNVCNKVNKIVQFPCHCVQGRKSMKGSVKGVQRQLNILSARPLTLVEPCGDGVDVSSAESFSAFFLDKNSFFHAFCTCNQETLDERYDACITNELHLLLFGE